jgi:methionyl-tRNA formyltransferase
LEILKENGYIPSLIVTSPDKPKGRKMLITPPPVKIWALKNKIPYIQPEKLDQKEICDVLRTLDFFLVVAYGKILPENLLNLPKLGSLNIHYSLLPKYRGASPVESVILNGDIETGITIQKMEFKMDSGPIVAQEKIFIHSNEKTPDLRKRLIKIGGELLVKTLPIYIENKIKLIPQNETEATYCKKIKKEDGLIDLNDSSIKNYNKYRAYAIWPRTYFFKNGKRIIITKAKLENDEFIIEKVIPENEKEIDYKN